MPPGSVGGIEATAGENSEGVTDPADPWLSALIKHSSVDSRYPDRRGLQRRGQQINQET